MPKKSAVRKAAPEKIKSLGREARDVGHVLPTRGMRQQFDSVMSPLTRQELATLEYAHTLANPWTEEPAGVPLILGSGVVRTNKAQLIFEGQAQANSNGFCFVTVSMDGWIDAVAGASGGTPQYQYTSYAGGTQGYPIWWSNNLYVPGVPGTLPVSTDTTAVAGLNKIQTKLLDGTVNTQTGIRMVACGLQVFPDSSEQTSQGKLMVVATSVPYGSVANGSITGSTYATLSGMPQDLMSVQTAPVAGWRSGRAMSAVAIPNDVSAFQFFPPPATGATVFGYPQLAAILSGGAPNQTFTFKIVFDYEFTFSMSNLTGVRDDPIYSAPQGILNSIQGGIQATDAHAVNASRPAGTHAWLNEINERVPGRAPQIVEMVKRPNPLTIDNRGNALSTLAKTALGHVVTFGKNLLPGWAKTGLSLLGF